MATNDDGLDAFGGVSNRLQPRVFEDLRGWIDALRAENEIQDIEVEVDWDCELGTVARKAFGTGEGPAILFKNISGYNASDARCSQLFTGGMSNYSRIAMTLGLPKDAPVTDMAMWLDRRAARGRRNAGNRCGGRLGLRTWHNCPQGIRHR